MTYSKDFEDLAVSALRCCAIDAVQKANSGHPGMALDAAPLVWELFAHHMKHNPANSQWFNRDRFVLSAGHVSALLYSLFYLFGYGIEKEDLASFRQLDSKTPGHPEYAVTPGVEISTGPLGQGLASAVGMAMAEARLAAEFNREGFEIVDHYTYVLTGDGCLQEGVTHEACSFAGTQKLGKLIVIYDRNKITIEGSTDLAFDEDVAARYKAYGWQVMEVADANDLAAISTALDAAKAEKEKPSLIIVQSKIAFGSPLEGLAKTHGSPLGEENVAATKKALGWPEDLGIFELPSSLQEGMKQVRHELAEDERAWHELFSRWQKAWPELAARWDQTFHPDFTGLNEALFREIPSEAEATRKSSGKILNILASELPQFMGGSADLAPSNNTKLNAESAFSPENRQGRNIHFGIREFGMACIMNGLNIHGGILSFCSTFFVFSDYMRSAIRSAALMNLPALFVTTHDSIGVGEDGPTHQPIEQLASLRAMPNLLVFRPADYCESAASYLAALQSGRPSLFAFSRQSLPQLPGSARDISRGAYVLSDKGDSLDLILMGSGSEVSLLLQVQDRLLQRGIGSRVVSMPCMELFLEQDESYRSEVIPPEISARLAVEAGASMPWYRFVGDHGAVHGLDHFGISAPGKQLFERFGFTAEALTEEALQLLEKED